MNISELLEEAQQGELIVFKNKQFQQWFREYTEEIMRESFQAARQTHGELSAENGWEYDYDNVDDFIKAKLGEL
jgi:hypothetical protein